MICLDKCPKIFYCPTGWLKFNNWSSEEIRTKGFDLGGN